MKFDNIFYNFDDIMLRHVWDQDIKHGVSDQEENDAINDEDESNIYI